MTNRRCATYLGMLLPIFICMASLAACSERRGSSPAEGEGEQEGLAEGEGEGEGQTEGEGEGSAEGEGEGDGGCKSRRDCPGQVCDTLVEPHRCVDPPLECEDNSQCPPGTICEVGLCQDGCNNNGDCANNWVCSRISATENRCFRSCKTSNCPNGFTCVDDLCLKDVVLCSGCEEDEDCGGPTDRCLAVGEEGKYCAKDCNLSRECPFGFRCQEILEDIWQCVPAVGDCTTNCQIIGCNDVARPFCNISSGRCEEQLMSCDPCDAHEACGPDARCLALNGKRYCITLCPNGQAQCPSGFRCDDSGTDSYCVPYSGTCDRCAGAICGPLSPFCNPENGACTECLSSADCGPGHVCGEQSRLCIAAGQACPVEPGVRCAEPTPFCNENVCVECMSSSDCPGEDSICFRFRCYGDDFCSRMSWVCPVQLTVCDNEARACVETGTCRKDEDCGGRRRCDIPNGVCYNADATCVTDAECPLTLTCDRNRRLCKGCVGNDDCRVPFQQCITLADGSYCQQI